MIQINKIEEETIEIFDINDNSLGFSTNNEFIDFRCQVVESQEPMTFEESKQPSGYYIIYNNEKYFINKRGEVPYFGKLRQWEDLFHRLLDACITKFE